MSEGTNKTTHAQRRRMESRTGARLKLKAGQYVRRLKEIADKVETVEPSQVPALRLKADIYSKLLSKCLPDLKAIEHSGEIGHAERLSDADLDQRIRELAGQLGIAGTAAREKTTH